jgi:Fuc2NAc and GlcNAc transferase
MDGIDGLAAGQSVLAGVGGGILLLLAGDAPLAFVSVLFAAGSAGFLIWNWAPAKIFLGDVGSGALGYLFALLGLASERREAVPILAWVLIFGVFVVDATTTLLRRVLRGERWYEAHRSHAYQRLVRGGWRHSRTTASILALTTLLSLLALAAVLRPELLLGLLAVGLLVIAAYYLAVERVSPM